MQTCAEAKKDWKAWRDGRNQSNEFIKKDEFESGKNKVNLSADIKQETSVF